MIENILVFVHVSVCLFLVVIVLLQHGKGADIGASFGGASQTVFGAGGAATLLHKITIGAAITFMFTSITLSIIASRSAKESIMSDEPTKSAPGPEGKDVKAPAAGLSSSPADAGAAGNVEK